MGEHPLLGDYENNKFGAAGFAVCRPGTPLSEQGFLRPVAPSLRQASNTVRCRMPWLASRFFFDANTLFLLYRARGVEGG